MEFACRTSFALSRTTTSYRVGSRSRELKAPVAPATYVRSQSQSDAHFARMHSPRVKVFGGQPPAPAQQLPSVRPSATPAASRPRRTLTAIWPYTRDVFTSLLSLTT